MLCLRCRALPSALRTSAMQSQVTRIPFSQPPSSSLRAFSAISPFPAHQFLRPSTQNVHVPSLFRPSLSTAPQSGLGFAFASSPAQTRSFSASASLGGKRRTYNPSRRVQKRRHGFLARLRTRAGRKILKNRKAKGRKYLSW